MDKSIFLNKISKKQYISYSHIKRKINVKIYRKNLKIMIKYLYKIMFYKKNLIYRGEK
ncbi:hypothetical protein HMPREF9015_01534 [Leptotrichia wadei F0279]|uniref:Uncharacterized protein n=1 Tax=Leptotrichia wadei (strain F0279) TaxID=888055 RepID=U2PEL9_LEPWF|nr:hypothetical protein HMPREF9015_01534 [Leptotrichia wadei F0279]